MTDSLNILDTMLDMMRLLRRRYDVQARAVGLTLARARALTTLSRMDGATQAELATALSIEGPTLKRQIDALEKAGFVARRPDPDDARKNALFLTDKGRDLAIVEFTRSLRADLVAGISPAELAQTSAVLTKIARNAAGPQRK